VGVRTNRTYKIIRFGSRYVNTQNCGTWLAQMPTIIKRRRTMKNVLTMMMVMCLTLPVNAVVTKPVKLNTQKPQVTVRIANKVTSEKPKNLSYVIMQIVGGCLLMFFIHILGDVAYDYLYSALWGVEAV
jgi:hypothetical protein